MTHILVIDQGSESLRRFVGRLETLPGEVEVQCVSSAEHGLQVLNDRRHEALVVPADGDGMHLVELAARSVEVSPALSVLVHTSSASDELAPLVAHAGKVRFIEDSMTDDRWAEAFEPAAERASKLGARLNVFDLLLLMALAGDCRTIRMGFDDGQGTLSFEQGALAYAATRGLRGPDALSVMVSMGGGVLDEILHADSRRYHANMDLTVAELTRRCGDITTFRFDGENCSTSGVIETETMDIRTAVPARSNERSPIHEILYSPEQRVGGREEMNIEQLKNAVDVLKDDLGVSLVSTDIFDATGLSYAGYNEQPAATALFADMTQRLHKALGDAGFPKLGRYYMLELEDGKMVVIAIVEETHWGMLVDGTKVNLGVLLNVALPRAIENLKSAL